MFNTTLTSRQLENVTQLLNLSVRSSNVGEEKKLENSTFLSHSSLINFHPRNYGQLMNLPSFTRLGHGLFDDGVCQTAPDVDLRRNRLKILFLIDFFQHFDN